MYKFSFDRWWISYIFFKRDNSLSSFIFESSSITKSFEAVGCSKFYLSEKGDILAKVVTDKYSRSEHFLKWLLRDYLEKRILLQTDAAKEYHSLMILRRAGLRVPRCYGWGVSLHPGNSGGSLLLMEHVKDSRPGGEVFDAMSETERLEFLIGFSHEVALLAKAGFVHRDLHYNNLLLDNDGRIIWIDAHVRRLPIRKPLHWPVILRSLTVSKLRGEHYCSFVEQQLRKCLSI